MNKQTDYVCGMRNKGIVLNDSQRSLVENNLGLVDYVIGKYTKRINIELEDKRSIGSLALCEAAYEYSPDKGVKFSTYASNAVLWTIMRYYRWLKAKQRGGDATVVSLNELHLRCALDEGEEFPEEVISSLLDDSVNVEEEALNHIFDRVLEEHSPIQTELDRSGMTVRQFAESRGVCRQTIYNLLDRELRVVVRKLYGIESLDRFRRKGNSYAYNL